MSVAWIAVLAVGAATIAIKAAGPVLVGDRELPVRASRVVELVGPALLAALVASQAFASEEQLVIDERGAGLIAAAVALLLRAPILVVIISAAVIAGVLRAVS